MSPAVQPTQQQEMDSCAHLESCLAAAEAAGCPHDWSNWLVQYAQLLARQGDAQRLSDLCQDLLGPTSWRPDEVGDFQGGTAAGGPQGGVGAPAAGADDTIGVGAIPSLLGCRCGPPLGCCLLLYWPCHVVSPLVCVIHLKTVCHDDDGGRLMREVLKMGGKQASRDKAAAMSVSSSAVRCQVWCAAWGLLADSMLLLAEECRCVQGSGSRMCWASVSERCWRRPCCRS